MKLKIFITFFSWLPLFTALDESYLVVRDQLLEVISKHPGYELSETRQRIVNCLGEALYDEAAYYTILGAALNWQAAIDAINECSLSLDVKTKLLSLLKKINYSEEDHPQQKKIRTQLFFMIDKKELENRLDLFFELDTQHSEMVSELMESMYDYYRNNGSIFSEQEIRCAYEIILSNIEQDKKSRINKIEEIIAKVSFSEKISSIQPTKNKHLKSRAPLKKEGV